MTEGLRAGARLGRHRICSLLGAGGMGRVHRALDTDRGVLVALKTLHHLGPESLERVRSEFRVLETLVHPNVVTFYELGLHGDVPYYTMRLVEGEPFLGSANTTLTREAASRPRVRDPHRPAVEASRGADEPGLAGWLLQLADAVEAMHERGLLHLDVKPGNLVIDGRGRLVLVDFGLATRLEGARSTAPSPQEATPDYASPEHLARREVGRASDWYSVGATLHHALTGAPPTRRAPSPELERHGRLGRICERLLCTDPGARADGRLLRELLGAEPRRPRTQRRTAAFVGRNDALARLDDGLRANSGRHTVLLLHGPGGVGRSALLGEFAARVRLRDARRAVALARAREWEDAPLGAIDDLLSEIGVSVRPLLHAEGGEARAHALARVAGLLGAQLAALANGERPALLLDDFQNCNPDDARLLRALLSSATTPPVLLVLAVRDAPEAADVVAELERWLLGLPIGIRYERHALRSLSVDETESLARALSGGEWPESSLAEVAKQADGNPTHLHELIASRSSHGESPQRRVEALPPRTREYLELASIAGARITQGVLRAALGAGDEEREILSQLRALGWISTTGPSTRDRVDVPRSVREAVLGLVDAHRLRGLHLRMARALRADSVYAAALSRHFALAGMPHAAAASAIRAGDEARHRLAFHRASELYRAAIEFGVPSIRSRSELTRTLAQLLAACGRGREAAEAWARAAESASAEDARRFRLAAAEQLLVSGHFAQGRTALRSSAREHGLAFPRSTVTAVGRTLVGLLRPPRWIERAISPARARSAQAKLQMANAAFRGLMPIDPARAAYFSLRATRIAARSGSRTQFADAAVGLASGVLAPAGGALARRAEHLLDEAEVTARDVGEATLLARVNVARASVRFWRGEWLEAHAFASRASAVLDRIGDAKGFERNIANLVITRSLEELGRWNDAATTTAEMYADALDRNDRYATVTASLNYGMISLARADAEGAHAWAGRALDIWQGEGMQVQHVYALRVRAYADLYAGDAPAAWSRVEAAWGAIRSGMHLRIPAARVDLELLRARILLRRAADEPVARATVAQARACLRQLAALRRRPDVDAHVRALEACALALEVDPASGAMRVRAAAEAYRACRLDALADACEWLGAASAEERAAATARLGGCGVVDASTWSRVFVPLPGIERGENPR